MLLGKKKSTSLLKTVEYIPQSAKAKEVIMIEAPIIVSEQQLQYQVMGHNHPPSTIIQDMLDGLDSESVELPVSQERREQRLRWPMNLDRT